MPKKKLVCMHHQEVEELEELEESEVLELELALAVLAASTDLLQEVRESLLAHSLSEMGKDSLIWLFREK